MEYDIRAKDIFGEVACPQGNGFVKIITGVRRCGKSFLLFKLFKKRLLKSGMSASLERSGDSFRKVVVVGVPQPKYTDDKGIAYVGVMDLLLNPSVLDDLLT